jgi:hypothetical protein
MRESPGAGPRCQRAPRVIVPRSWNQTVHPRFIHAYEPSCRSQWRLNLVPLPFDCACARLDRFPSPGRERASLLLRWSRTPGGDDLRASHPRSRKHGDRRLCGSLDPLPSQRSRPLHSRPDHRRIDRRGARARHDRVRRRPGLDRRIASPPRHESRGTICRAATHGPKASRVPEADLSGPARVPPSR